MSESPQNLIQKLFGIGGNKSSNQEPTPTPSNNAAPIVRNTPTTLPDQTPADPNAPQKKKNIFQKIFGGGKNNDPNKQPPPDSPAPQ
jgi:penicillin-binding protein 1B